MRRIFLIMAAFLLCIGSAMAAELKVMVPVDDFKQLNSRLEALEQENIQLKQAVDAGTVGVAGGQETTALQSQLAAVEQENNRLKQQLQTLQDQDTGAGQADADLAARVSSLEQENSRLQGEIEQMRSQEQGSVAESDVEARLAAAENENSQLRQQVRAIKEGGVAAVMSGDKSTARHIYATARNVSTFHNFKF